MMKRYPVLIIVVLSLISGGAALAGEADVLRVKAVQSGKTWSFSVTVRHGDEGWDHYADRWEILSLGGEVLGARILAHPHVGEQPFTRSLSGVEIPEGMKEVVLRARDSVHGYGGAEVKVQLAD